MTKEEVLATIQTPEVLRAFELSELNRLPWEVRKAYEEEDLEYDRYSLHTEEIAQEREEKGKKEGLKEGKKEVALGMLKKDMDITLITDLTGLTEDEIKALEPKKEC